MSKSDKYCPAGKIECERVYKNVVFGDDDFGCNCIGNIRLYEACPIPSRQKPMWKGGKMLMKLEDVKRYCVEYDQEYGEYPESYKEGDAVWEWIKARIKEEK